MLSSSLVSRFLWYQMLMDKGLLDFTEEPVAEEKTEETKPEGEA